MIMRQAKLIKDASYFPGEERITGSKLHKACNIASDDAFNETSSSQSEKDKDSYSSQVF